MDKSKVMLVANEILLDTAEGILYQLYPAYPSHTRMPNYYRPINNGDLVLSTRRLIFVSQGWRFSITGIVSLSERPPMMPKKHYPYQAVLVSQDGMIIVIETLTDNLEARGDSLSAFLTKAFLQLATNAQTSQLVQSYAHQVEEERRRNNYDSPGREEKTESNNS